MGDLASMTNRNEQVITSSVETLPVAIVVLVLGLEFLGLLISADVPSKQEKLLKTDKHSLKSALSVSDHVHWE